MTLQDLQSMNRMWEPLLRASSNHANWGQKEKKDLKEYIETCNARHTVEEKMVGLTGLLS